MFPILAVIGQNSAPPAPAWNKVLEMKFNGSFSDSTGRHIPVATGGTFESIAGSEGDSLLLVNNGRVYTDGFGVTDSDFNFSSNDFRVTTRLWYYPYTLYSREVVAWTKRVDSSAIALSLVIFRGYGTTDTIFVREYGNIMSYEIEQSALEQQWRTIEVSRQSATLSLLIDGDVVATASASALSAINGGDRDGFTIGGFPWESLFVGYIDNFVVYTK